LVNGAFSDACVSGCAEGAPAYAVNGFHALRDCVEASGCLLEGGCTAVCQTERAECAPELCGNQIACGATSACCDEVACSAAPECAGATCYVEFRLPVESLPPATCAETPAMIPFLSLWLRLLPGALFVERADGVVPLAGSCGPGGFSLEGQIPNLSLSITGTFSGNQLAVSEWREVHGGACTVTWSF
jgi:hypothetical protein